MDVHQYIGAPDGRLPSYFEPMLRDRGRSDQYSAAIRLELARFRREQGRPAVVLDLGCGTGLLTALALKWGAAAVVACDLNALMSKGLAPAALELEEEELDESAEGAWGGYVELSGEEALAATATAGLAGGAAAAAGVVLRHPRTGQVVRFVHGQYDPATGSPPVDMWVTEVLGTLTTSELMPSILTRAAAGLRQFRAPSGELTRYCVPREARQYATSYTAASFVGPAPPNDGRWLSSNDADDRRLYRTARRVGSRRLIRRDELARPSGPLVHSTVCEGVAQMGPGSDLLVLEWECELHPGVVLRNLLDTLEEDLPGAEAREGRYAAWGFWLYRVEAPVKFQVAGYDVRDAVPVVWVRDGPGRKMLLPPRQKRRRPTAEQPQDLEHTRLGVVTPASCSEFSEIGGAVFVGLDAVVPVNAFVELSGGSLYSSEPEGPEDEEVWHQVVDPATSRLWLGRAAPDRRVVLSDPPRFARPAQPAAGRRERVAVPKPP